MAAEPLQGMPAAPANWVQRYLALLGVEAGEPGYDLLTRLTRAQVQTVIFENISSVLRRRAHRGRPVPPPDQDAILTAWEQRRGGGVCFEATVLFHRLLVALGYRARLVLALIGFPGSHMAVLVELDGRGYLADVANGAPFFEPIPLDGPFEVRRAGLSYRFHAGDTPETWIQDRWIEGEWRPFCFYDLRLADAAVQETAYQHHHTPGKSWVVDSVTLIRCEPDAVFVLRNEEFTHFTPDGKQTRPVSGQEAYAQLAAEVFHLPALPMAEGLRARAELRP